MEASTSKTNTFTQAKPISELLAGLSGILNKDAIQTLTAKKKARSAMAQTLTTEKIIRPLTIAEMRADILALKQASPRRVTQAPPSTKKKGWNSSVKLDNKIKSHTANGQMKNNPVRKVLNFQQPKPKVSNPRVTMHNSETPKFPKPEFRPKKSLHLQAKNIVRISGICNIPQTPVETVKPIKNRMTIQNKENCSYQANINRKLLATTKATANKENGSNQANINSTPLVPPTPILTNLAVSKRVVDTPLSNSSWKSGSDASFLQKEKEIHDIEEKVKAITEEHTLENIAEVSPPMSTPFKEYRSVQEFFNNSSIVETSTLYDDNTIMCFDKPSICNDNTKREESVIVSLCDLLNKATMTNTETKENSELDNLLETEKQIEQNIKLLKSSIRMLTNIKESQLKSLQNLQKQIEKKRAEIDPDNTLVAVSKTPKVEKTDHMSVETSPIISRPPSAVKKSPCYKIPKKNFSLRKKAVSKSVLTPSVITPIKDIKGRALTEYMQIKEQMNFLSTPKVSRPSQIPDTPAVTSHNLQLQLDKLYNQS